MGTFLRKDGMLSPIVCDNDELTPLNGINSRAHTNINLYLLNIYIFVRFLLVACSNGNMSGGRMGAVLTYARNYV